MIRPTFSWNDYFSGTSIQTTLSGEHKTRQNPSVTSVYVLNCLFNECTSGSSGGALCCTSVTSLLIEFSYFFSCKTSSNSAGAIYFSNGGGQCVLYGVCGYDCCSTHTSTSYYQFAIVEVNNGASSKNYINYTSISRCVNERSDSHYITRLDNGKICCLSVNISMNKSQQQSGIITYPFADSNSVTSSLFYSTIIDNKSSGSICIYFHRGGSNHEIKCCNILRNTQVSTSYGLIFADTNSVIKDSCILENTATSIFYIHSSYYSITLSNCTVDRTTNNGYLKTQNTVTKSFILGLNHMSTKNCNAEYDSIGTLSAIPYSNPTKKVLSYTCNCQGRISISYSIVWLLIFTFFHSNPSVDY
jgi:hypothetical protein